MRYADGSAVHLGKSPVLGEVVVLDDTEIMRPWQSFGSPPISGSPGRLCDVCGISVNVELGGGDAEGINRPNVDLRKLPTVDYCLDLSVDRLPFHDNHAEHIRMLHLLNHLSETEGARLLRECFRVLRPQGILYLMVTDLVFLCERILADGARRCWLQGIHGDGNDGRPDAFHKWNYSQESLTALLQEVGFPTVQVVGCYNRWEIKVMAFKP